VVRRPSAAAAGDGGAAQDVAGPAFELVLAGGRRLRISIDFHAEALTRLLAVLDAR
jgi:hypothetical protein